MTVHVIETTKEIITQLFAQKEIELEKRYSPNEFIIFKAPDCKTRLTRVNFCGTLAILIKDDLMAFGVKPMNKEQALAMDILLNDEIPVNIITGPAGGGKTYIALACAVQKMMDGKYKKIILTRPMSEVGRYSIGTLPGDVSEKFLPFLGNFASNMEQMSKGGMEDFMEKWNIECIPIQLVRGSSFADAYIIVDEAQVLGFHEMLTLGTRVAKNSKIVIMGDLDQRDENIAVNKTGLDRISNSHIMKASKLSAHIELIKSERSEVCKLFTDAFKGYTS